MAVIVIPDDHWSGVRDKLARDLIDLMELCGRRVSGASLKELVQALAQGGPAFDQYLAQAAQNATGGPERLRLE